LSPNTRGAAARPPNRITCALLSPARGRKVSDEYTVPVCRLHHRELHRYGDEASWWAGASLDPVPIALALWRHSRPDEAGRSVADLPARGVVVTYLAMA
jgi:hypothetical protein